MLIGEGLERGVWEGGGCEVGEGEVGEGEQEILHNRQLLTQCLSGYEGEEGRKKKKCP